MKNNKNYLYIKLIESFTGKKIMFENENTSKWSKDNIHEYISNRLGQGAIKYDNSKDWNNLSVWPLSDSNYTGPFLIIDNDTNVVLLERKHNKIDENTYEDRIINTASDFGSLSLLLDQIK